MEKRSGVGDLKRITLILSPHPWMMFREENFFHRELPKHCAGDYGGGFFSNFDMQSR
jgi:hypothetical protein